MSLLSQLLLELNAPFFSEITTAMKLLERKIWMLANVAKNADSKHAWPIRPTRISWSTSIQLKH